MVETGGTKIGTMFAEIDLDRSKYDAGLDKAIESAKEGTISIGKAWQLMGSKSTENIDKLKAGVINSLDVIKSHSSTTFSDITRAEIAAKDKILAYNKKFYGSSLERFTAEEKAWQQLGSKSERSIKAAAANITAAYEEIATNALSTTKDIERAEIVSKGKLEALNKKYYAKVESLADQAARLAEKEASETAKAWATMGTKSSKNIADMKSEIISSYEKIKNNAFSTAEDIERAERASKEQLEAINKKYYKKVESLADKARAVVKQQSKEIESAWAGLGTKSSKEIDDMRKKVTADYERIKNSALSTAEDIERAEKASKKKLERINERYANGAIDDIERVGAAARATSDEASRSGSIFREMFSAFTLANVATDAIYALGRAMKTTFTDAFDSVEEFKLSSASLGATIATFAKTSGKDMAEVYKQSYAYAEQLNLKMEEWNAKTVATGENLRAMVETMYQAGVGVDVNNKAQEKGIIAIANALAIVTKGQEQDKQFRQETRGLLDGEVRFTNRLAVMIDSMVEGPLTKQVDKWRESGTLVENLGTMLTGFSAATKDLEQTWLAVSTTAETVYHRVLRGMFVPVYEDIVNLSRDATLSMLDQERAGSSVAGVLKVSVYRAWVDIKNIVSLVGSTISAFEVPLKFMGLTLGLALDGWGQILAVLTPVYNRVTSIVGAMWELVEAAGDYGTMLYMFVTGRFEAAWKAWDDTKNSWNESGRKTGEAFAAGLTDEIEKGISEYNKEMGDLFRTKEIEAPEMAKGGGAEQWDEYEKAALKALSNTIEAKEKELAEYRKFENAKAEVIGLKEAEIQEMRDKAHEAELREAEKATAEHTKIIDEFNTAYLKSVTTSTDYEKIQLDIRYKTYEKHIADKEMVNRLYFAELRALQDKEVSDFEARASATESAFAAGIDVRFGAQAKAYQEFTAQFEDDYKKATMSTTDFELDALNARYKEYEKYVLDKNKLDELYAIESNLILKEQSDEIESKTDEWKDAFSGWANGFVDDLNEMAWGADLSFNSILTSFGKMLTSMQIQKAASGVMEWSSGFDFVSMISGIGSGSSGPTTLSNGATINPSGAVFGMAGGGIINEHVIGLGMSSGQSYEFGEGGVPEAVISSNDWGKSGSREVVVNIIDQRSSDSPAVETSTTQGANGQQQIQVLIRKEVQDAMSNGTMDKSMQFNYGIKRAGIRR